VRLACRLTRANARGLTEAWSGVAAATDAAWRLSSTGSVAAGALAVRGCWSAERLGNGAADAAACCTAAGGAFTAGAAAETAPGGAVTVGAAAETAAGDLVVVGAAAETAAGGAVAVGAAAETAAGGAVAVGAAAETAAGDLVAVGATAETAAAGDAAAIRGGLAAAGRATVADCCLPAALATFWLGAPRVKCKRVSATLPPPIPPITAATAMIHSARNTRWARADQELSG
jgi:hypothetical protein